ncbi:hypothetical protein FQN57_005088 [Myotisia sp. PD_48]|nr:hypothetical protein FQN57_005088 [Myotisia sp. PD_48]
MFVFAALSTGGMLFVALSPAYNPTVTNDASISTKMLGVVLASLSSGGGELSFLGLTHFYGPLSLAAWGSGTGAAGLVGAGAYALATTSFGFSVRATLLVSAFFPIILLVSFFGILPRGPLRELAVVKSGYEAISEVEGGDHVVDDGIDIPDGGFEGTVTRPEDESERLLEVSASVDLTTKPSENSNISWGLFKANLKRARVLFFPFMLPLLLVYIAEYTINQGVAPTLLFPLERSPFKHFRSFYPTYNAIYQVGVFISRSSTPFFRIHDLYFPSLLQIANLVLLTLHALFDFISNVYFIFLIIFWEGLLGGLVYVNTFAEISDRVPEKDREFSLGATTVTHLGTRDLKMIDHVLGRPSTQFRKIQVFAVVSFWSLYLLGGNKNGPPVVRFLSSRLQGRMTPWQSTVMTLLFLYISRNFAKLASLECPEPLANLYSRSYFRATWVTTALDAGFWTAMNIRRKWMRDLASIVFSIYYLIAAEQADEKVRKVRATLTVDHMRVSWNKMTTPYLTFVSKLFRPRLCRYDPIPIKIPRPRESSYREPTDSWLYFDGSIASLREQTKIVLDIPGGGFVAMNPRTSDDKLLAWAGKTGVPILSLDYKKAPEYPYPYALNECYDVYHTIIKTQGRCMGLSGKTCPTIIVTGDSAGGNLAAGLTLMILQSGSTDSRKWRGEDSLPVPAGLVLIYPSLDMNVGSWMTDEQMSLIRDRGMRKTNRNVLRRKSEDYHKLTPLTPHPSDDDLTSDQTVKQQHPSDEPTGRSASNGTAIKNRPGHENLESQVVALTDTQPRQIRTRLAVSSMISYFNDRVITPEMMRALIILYIGPYNRPDFSTDFLLSPLLAPENLLARFPKTYFLTGERDPMVDDTVIFAGRIRQAKVHRFRERQDLGLEKSGKEFDEKAHVEVTLVPGISHGFLNFVSIFPDGWKQLFRCARWIQDLFAAADRIHRTTGSASSLSSRHRTMSDFAVSDPNPGRHDTANGSPPDRHHRRVMTGESSVDEDGPLEMSLLQMTRLSSSSSSKSPPSNELESSRITNTDVTSTHSCSQPLPAAHSSPGSDIKGVVRVSTQKQKQTFEGSFTGRSRTKPISLGLNIDNIDHHESELIAAQQGRMVLHRQASLTSLPSEEDLLNRRMNGLAGGLMGVGEGARTP